MLTGTRAERQATKPLTLAELRHFKRPDCGNKFCKVCVRVTYFGMFDVEVPKVPKVPSGRYSIVNERRERGAA